jgi:hypothetical protein
MQQQQQQQRDLRFTGSTKAATSVVGAAVVGVGRLAAAVVNIVEDGKVTSP